MSLINIINNYVPSDERELRDKEQMIKFIGSFKDVLSRENTIGHFTSSAFIVDKSKTKFLAVYHIINDGWTYPGGHADGEEDLLKVALREAEEETGLKPKVLSNKPIMLSSNCVDVHIKRGRLVSSHIHFDVLYLMEADDSSFLQYRKDESKGVKWISFDDYEQEKMAQFVKPIIKKLISKIKGENNA